LGIKITDNVIDEACIGEKRNIFRCLLGSVKERDAGLDGRIRFKQVFKNWRGNASTRLIWLRYGESRGLSWNKQLNFGFYTILGV
jgi:hypothetical protein